MHFLIHSGLIFPPQYTIYGEGVREEQYQQDRLYLSHLRLRIRIRGGRDGGLEELDLDDLVHVRQRLLTTLRLPMQSRRVSNPDERAWGC